MMTFLPFQFLLSSISLTDIIFLQTDDDEALQWQKSLYKKIGSKKDASKTDLNCIVERVLAMAKVLHGLHLVRKIIGN